MNSILSCLGLRNRDHEHSFVKSGSSTPNDTEQYRDNIWETKSSFTVLVTGMGAFPSDPLNCKSPHYTENDNTSHLITTLLPSQLPPYSTHNPTSIQINIINPTSCPGTAVKSEYRFVRQYCQDLWEKYGNEVDLVLHLGMADGWEWYSIERSAWKQGTVKSVDYGNGRESVPVHYYTLPDDIGKTVKDAGSCPWSKEIPKRLMAGLGFDVNEMARNVQRDLNRKIGRRKKEGAEEVEVRTHPDAGNYLCGFIAYESAARRLVGGYKAKTMFCHVPGWRDEKRLEVGRDFVCSLIAYIAAQQS